MTERNSVSFACIADVDVDVGELIVIISMMVMCDDIGIIEHDGRRPGLPNALVVMEHDNNRTNRGISL